MSPRVSVLLPVYNSQAYLAPALDSLLAQTFTDFEVIAVNDGSEDDSAAILASYAKHDRRICVYQQANCGLPATLNRAIGLSAGEYLARMDADDISLPHRLARQVAFLDANPRVGVCGSWLEAFDQRGAYPWHYPVSDAAIRCQLLFGSAFAHPAVMLRANIMPLAGGYAVDWPVAEDYELWLRLAQQTTFANIPETLLRLRIHAAQKGTQETRAGTLPAALEVLHRAQLAQLGLRPGPEEYAIHRDLSANRLAPSRHALEQAESWLKAVLTANRLTGYLPEPALSHALSERWWLACFQARALGWWIWQQYWRSPLRSAASTTWKRELRFCAACAWHTFTNMKGSKPSVYD